jgi:hypothetical protein
MFKTPFKKVVLEFGVLHDQSLGNSLRFKHENNFTGKHYCYQLMSRHP